MPETAPAILVIDDQIDNFDIVEMLLSREEYVLFYSSSGPRAFALMENIHPDLIILDAMMPEMDGFEVCRRLKKNPQSQHIPVLMVTALDSREDLARCLEEGADDFLGKPIEGVALKARVRSLLRIKRQYDQLQNLIQLREEALRLQEDLSTMIIRDLRNSLADTLLATYAFLRYYRWTRQKRPNIFK